MGPYGSADYNPTETFASKVYISHTYIQINPRFLHSFLSPHNLIGQTLISDDGVGEITDILLRQAFEWSRKE